MFMKIHIFSKTNRYLVSSIKYWKIYVNQEVYVREINSYSFIGNT